MVELSDGRADLEGILALQRENLRTLVSAEEAALNGFVTVEHTFEVLAQMHALMPSVVARSAGRVVGYALSMAPACRALVPVLEPMFATVEQLPSAPSHFYVMGQVCVARSHRGQGLFDAMYRAHRSHFAQRYDALVTEISTRNARSLRAHARVGFRDLTTYMDATDEWRVVVLELGTPS